MSYYDAKVRKKVRITKKAQQKWVLNPQTFNTFYTKERIGVL